MTSIIEESKKAKQKGLFGFWRSKKMIIIIIFIPILLFAYKIYSSDETQERVVLAREWIVKKGDISLSVESNGRVVAKDGVDLSFSVSGDNLEVKDVYFKEGDRVVRGDKIASVKTDSLDLNLRTAWSSYQSSLADYNETMSGAKEEDVISSQEKIKTAEMSLNQAISSMESTKLNIQNNIFNAERKVDDAKKSYEKNKDVASSEDVKNSYESLVEMIKSINISLDAIIKNSDEILGVDSNLNESYKSNLGAMDSSSLSRAKNTYLLSKQESRILNEVSVNINFFSDFRKIDEAALQAAKTLEILESHLYEMRLVLEATITSSNLSQLQLDSKINSIASNRTNINTRISSLNTKIKSINDIKNNIDSYRVAYEDALRSLEKIKIDGEKDIENAQMTIANREISLEQARRDLERIKSPLSASVLASANSRLTSASVSLEKARQELSRATIVSPIDGIISQLNYAPGDIIIGSGKSVVTIINNDTLYIEVNIEEADISKLEVGQKAYATFDALDELKLEGEISFISLTSQSSNSGITTYLVRVIFSKDGHEIREGMNAFVNFVSSEVKDVLIIPVNAVRNVSGKPSVQIKDGEWISVITGFTDGRNVEVISGLSVGDILVY